jgi:hypothetical protein
LRCRGRTARPGLGHFCPSSQPSVRSQTTLKANRLPRKQKGQRFETDRAFFLRYYYTAEDGARKQKAVLIAYKSDLYRTWADVEPLIKAELERINAASEATPTGRDTLADFIDKVYLPWCEAFIPVGGASAAA